MPVTILYAGFAFLGLIIIFGLTFKMKGWKAAFITTGIAFVVFAMLFVAMINAITSTM